MFRKKPVIAFVDDDCMLLYITCKSSFPFTQIHKKDISINCYLQDKEVVLTAWKEGGFIFKVNLRYVKNQKYKIEYSFEKEPKEIRYYLTELYTKEKKVFTKDNLTITQEMNPILAKKELKRLRKEGLVGETRWDSFIEFYDIPCYACHHTSSEIYEWVSNPSHGMVKRLSEIGKAVLDTCGENQFIFDKTLYEKIPENQWFGKKYWNKEEYEKVAKHYYDHGLIETKDGIDRKHLAVYQKDWPKFKDAWINSGRLWRNRITREVMNELSSNFVPSDLMEQVTTKGWMIEPKLGSEPCPVCERLYNAVSAYNGWYPHFLYFLRTLKIAIGEKYEKARNNLRRKNEGTA